MRPMSKHNQEQLAVTLLNITHYQNMEEYKSLEDTVEEAEAEFQEALENGFIRDITLGTYNGATQTTQYRTLDESHYYTAILRDIREDESILPLLAEEEEELTEEEAIRAYTEVYDVFTLNNHLYTNLN